MKPENKGLYGALVQGMGVSAANALYNALLDLTDSSDDRKSVLDPTQKLTRDPNFALNNSLLGLENKFHTLLRSSTKDLVTKSVFDAVINAAQSALNNSLQGFENKFHALIRSSLSVLVTKSVFDAEINALRYSISETERSQDGQLSHDIRTLQSAISGDILLSVDANEDISAAELNAAESGALKRSLSATIQTLARDIHFWANFEPVITATESVADADVLAPSLVWKIDPAESPRFRKGVLDIEVTLDTDAGSSKTYVAGDLVSVTLKTKADNTWLGHTVASVIKTFTVV